MGFSNLNLNFQKLSHSILALLINWEFTTSFWVYFSNRLQNTRNRYFNGSFLMTTIIVNYILEYFFSFFPPVYAKWNRFDQYKFYFATTVGSYSRMLKGRGTMLHWPIYNNLYNNFNNLSFQVIFDGKNTEKT